MPESDSEASEVDQNKAVFICRHRDNEDQKDTKLCYICERREREYTCCKPECDRLSICGECYNSEVPTCCHKNHKAMIIPCNDLALYDNT